MRKKIIRRAAAKLPPSLADQESMQERRLETRLLCADLIDVFWTDKSGHNRRATANLEDISNSGACLQMDVPVPYETVVRIAHPKAELEGRVRYCVFRDIGYFLGVQFAPGTRWNRQAFRPKHLLDPRSLLAKFPKQSVKKSQRPSAQA